MKDTKIEISDGELAFCERKEYAPLTYKYVEECLQKIITDEVRFIDIHPFYPRRSKQANIYTH